MSYRRPIRRICRNWKHVFPVRMKYRGTCFRNGRLVHMMVCPVCGCTKYFEYINARTYRQVA